VTVYHPINAISGDIIVRGTNSYGNGVSSTLALTVNSFPVEAGQITGPINVSVGQKSVKYTVTPIANATSYVWSLNNIQIGASATNTILIDYDQGRHSGDLSVKGQNSCGGGWSSSLAITVNSLPEIAGNITGPTIICKGTSTIYTVPPIRNATSYDWTLPSGATGSSTTNIITVNFNSSAISGDITVKGTNSTGKGVASSLKINVTTSPLISFSGNVLHSNVSTGNQWHNQNGIINGATLQDYSVAFSGDYYAIQTNGACSSEASNVIHIVVTGIEDNINKGQIKVYPNPVSDELIIEMEGNKTEQNFQILNSGGQVIFDGCVVDKTIVRTGSFTAGIYLVRFDDGKTVEVKKIVKR
jgi:hypothetical protein